MKKKMSLAQFTSKLDNGGYASATAARRALGRAQELSTQDMAAARAAVDNHFQVPPAAPSPKKKPAKKAPAKKVVADVKTVTAAPAKPAAKKAAKPAAKPAARKAAPSATAPSPTPAATATPPATPIDLAPAKPVAKKRRAAKRNQLSVLLEQRKALAETAEILRHLKTTTDCLAVGSLRLKSGEDVIPQDTLEPLLLSVRQVFKNAGAALGAAGLSPKVAPAAKAPSPSKAKSQANGKSTHAAAMAANTTA